MTGPVLLRADDRDLVRLVARCYSNAEIAGMLGISRSTLGERLGALHGHLGTGSRAGGDSILCRARMVAWAYENGIVEVGPRPAVAVEDAAGLTAELLDACRAIVADRPRGDLRQLATRALRAAQGYVAGGRPAPRDRRDGADTAAVDAAW